MVEQQQKSDVRAGKYRYFHIPFSFEIKNTGYPYLQAVIGVRMIRINSWYSLAKLNNHSGKLAINYSLGNFGGNVYLVEEMH